MEQKNDFMDSVYKVIESICKIFMIVMVIVVAYTVFGRYVLGKSPNWGEELGIFCMVWIAFLSASLAVKDGRHIRMTIIEYIVPKKIAKALHKGVYLFILLVAIIFLRDGSQLTALTKMAIMPGLRIPSAYLNLAVPVAGGCIIIMLIGKWRDNKWH